MSNDPQASPGPTISVVPDVAASLDGIAFLRRVALPELGPVCLASAVTDQTTGRAKDFHETFLPLGEVDAYAAAQIGAGRETWYAPAQFALTKRLTKNVVSLRTLYLDADVKADEYASLDEVEYDLARLAAHGYPPPSLIVGSGHGLHAYWPLTRPVDLPTWRRLAHGLQHASAAIGAKWSLGIIGDAARLLRLPGTANFKRRDDPRPVFVRRDGRSADPDTLPKGDAPPRADRQSRPASTGRTGPVAIHPAPIGIKVAPAFDGLPSDHGAFTAGLARRDLFRALTDEQAVGVTFRLVDMVDGRRMAHRDEWRPGMLALQHAPGLTYAQRLDAAVRLAARSTDSEHLQVDQRPEIERFWREDDRSDRAPDRRTTIATLVHWAEHDDPDAFDALLQDIDRMHGDLLHGAAAATAPGFVGSVSSVSGSCHLPLVWRSPTPLDDLCRLSPVPKFDPRLLPDAFRYYVVDAAARLSCPLEFIAGPLVVSAGAVIGSGFALQPKSVDPWHEVPNVWGAVIGAPGSRKTPALSEALRFVRQHEQRLAVENAAAKTAFKLQMIAHEATISNAKAAAKKGSPVTTLPPEPVPPPEKRILTHDSSHEKLGEICRDNSRGVLTVRDEGSGFLASIDDLKNTAARAFYLEGWNGKNPFSFDRIGRGTVPIARLCLSVHMGLQPDKIAAAITGTGQHGAGTDDGLIQRFQLLMFPDLVPAVWTDRPPDLAALQAAQAAFDHLATLEPSKLGATVDPYTANTPLAGPAVMTLDDRGRRLFRTWYMANQCRILRERDPVIASHLAKYQKLVVALALICHLVDGGRNPVSATAMLRAIRWARFLEPHARRVYAYAARTGRGDATRRLAEWIASGTLGPTFTLRAVRRRHWSGLTEHEDVARALAELVEAGWLQRLDEQPRGPGRPTERWLVNPAVLAPG